MKSLFTKPFLLGLLLLLFSSLTVFGQLSVEWDKSFTPSLGPLKAVASAGDGGFLLGGDDAPLYSLPDYGIMKIDANGNKLWEKSYGGNKQEKLVSLVSLPDGGFLLAGTSESGASGDKTEENRGYGVSSDYWVVRVDAGGNKLWDRTFGGHNEDWLGAAISTTDGGFLLAGSSNSYASGDKSEDARGNQDYWVVRIDDSGNKLWDRTFGGASSENLRAATSSPDGGFLVGGYSMSGAYYDKTEESRGGSDYWVVRIDDSGNKLWDRTFGGHTAESVEALAPVADGGFLIGGDSPSRASGDKSEDNNGYNDLWVIRVDADGNKLWDKVFGGNASDYLEAIITTPDGNYVLAGDSYSSTSADKTEDSRGYMDYWAIKIDVEGQVQWDKTLGANHYDELVGIVSSSENEYLFAGNSRSGATFDKTEDPESEYDYWIVKLVEDTPPVPTPGHITGGGWSGNARFGFVVKQKDEKDIPKGKVHFHLAEDMLSFQSERIDWMAVNEERAWVQGMGKLGGLEGYKFLLSIRDLGKEDYFRIIIWDSEENVVYDNEQSAALYAEAGTAIQGGSIVIHKQKEENGVGTKALSQALDSALLAGLRIYPTDLGQESLWLEYPSMEGIREFRLIIYNSQSRIMADRVIKVSEEGGKEQLSLNSSQWPSGIYHLIVQRGSMFHQQKLVK